MNVPGGIGVGGDSPAGAVRGERGDVGGAGGSPAGVEGVWSDILLGAVGYRDGRWNISNNGS